MYTLLIADDEALEREGLELMIRHMMPDTFRFLHAENGRRAIQLAEEERPDFIFMDIKMPGIQGLEAVREILARHPDTLVVIVSAYDYFVYAKEGLGLGVRNYLLKPARREEVHEVLKALVAEAEEAKRARDKRLEMREKLSQLLPLAENELSLMLMLDYALEAELTQLADMLQLDWTKGYAMVISFWPHSAKEWSSFQLIKKELHEAVKLWTKSSLSCLVSPFAGHQLALFIPFPPGRPGYSQRLTALEQADRLYKQIENRFGITLAIGIGSVHDGWEGIGRSYREAVRVSSDKQDHDMVSIKHYDDIRESSGGMAYYPEEERLLVDALLRHNKLEAILRFDQVYERLERSKPGQFTHIRSDVISLMLFLSRSLKAGDGTDLISYFACFDEPDSFRAAVKHRLGAWIEDLRESKEQGRSQVLQRALLYIAKRYKEDISMEQTAEYVNLSPYYFSKLFKQQTGENFSDYLTRVRIEEAKRLIAEGRLSLKEICYEAGYKDPNYFSRAFKKAAGMTPSEFRQQMI